MILWQPEDNITAAGTIRMLSSHSGKVMLVSSLSLILAHTHTHTHRVKINKMCINILYIYMCICTFTCTHMQTCNQKPTVVNVHVNVCVYYMYNNMHAYNTIMYMHEHTLCVHVFLHLLSTPSGDRDSVKSSTSTM